MRKSTKWLAGLSLIAAGIALADPPQINTARVDAMIKEIQPQMQAQAQPGAPKPDPAQLQKNVMHTLQIADALKAEALKAGLDKKPETQAAWQNVQAQFYANQYFLYLQSQVNVSDADLRKDYDKSTREIQLLPIQFSNEAAANAALTRLKKGLSFEALMKEENQPAPKDSWVPQAQLPAPLAKIVNTLGIGKITDKAVNLNGQFYLLKLANARRLDDAPPFEQVKEQFREKVKQDKAQEQIVELLKQHGIQQQP